MTTASEMTVSSLVILVPLGDATSIPVHGIVSKNNTDDIGHNVQNQ